MSARRPPVRVGEVVEVEAERLNSLGDAVCRLDGFVVFVPFLLPGEVARVRITQLKRDYASGRLEGLTRTSPFRRKPPCPLFGRCGGCQLQHAPYGHQLELKGQMLREAFYRIGKLELSEELEVVPSGRELGYRNKLASPVAPRGRLGLYARMSHRLVEVDDCLIQEGIVRECLKSLKGEVKRAKIFGFDEASHAGDLRHALIVGSERTGQTMVVLVALDLTEGVKRLVEGVKGTVSPTSLWINLNRRRGNVILGDEFLHVWGEEEISERLGPFRFKRGPASFFQVNVQVAEELFSFAERKVAGSERVLELYCGLGSMTAFLARSSGSVVGVEEVGEAVRLARANAIENGIDNATFVEARAEEALYLLEERFDSVVLDPPRGGPSPEVLKAIGESSASRVVYVSCNPSTLARDSSKLLEMGFKLVEVRAFDMFPQTAHLEAAAVFER